MEWLIAIGVVLAIITTLPWAITAAKRSVRGNGRAAGAVLSVGLAFSVLFDPRKQETIERAARLKESGAEKPDRRWLSAIASTSNAIEAGHCQPPQAARSKQLRGNQGEGEL